MSSFVRTELSLPAQVNMQPMVHSFVLALGELSGLAREEAESLAHVVLNVRVGHIFVNQIGSDSLSGISQATRDLGRMTRAAVVGLYLPLAQRGTPELCQAAEKLGFFFSGVQPQLAPDGDFLRLQRLQVPLDLDRVHLASATARELLDYILADRRRWQ
jgi:hypothetical protein